MKEKTVKAEGQAQKGNHGKEDNEEGYPFYPATEDIYGNYKAEKTLNPENPSINIEPVNSRESGLFNEKDFSEDFSGADLDIPGSELDDDLEFIGSEDEENNYYSLGGDDHNDLEEDDEEAGLR